MTHGEELGSDVHQDSIVLTYLEGLLMHQAAEGSGTAVDKKSAGHNEEDQNFNISGNAFPACQSNGPVLNTHSYQGSGMLHLKKARLLQSSEDWNAAKRKRLSDSIVNLNVKKEALLAGMVDNVPKGKQDSTLLASLLQSFSSRLQTVALSQQIRQSLKEQGYALGHDSLKVEKDLRCYGVASSHLKTLLKKSKAKDQKPDTNLPDVSKNLIRDRFVESPHHVGQSGTKVMSEPLSCAARLQAVASMVEKRASPATSPKPSVACSQLALLLSSEAHLQQYSREHALKTQNANQAASERLAAMARLQENGQKEVGSFQLSKGMSSHLNGQARTSSSKLMASKNTAFQNPMGVVPSSPKNAGYKNSLERNHLKQAANNSLLLHLLKSQTIPKPMNGHNHSERGSIFEDSSTPTTIDEYSDNNPSFTDDSSGDESSYSNCVPIDLSCKHRIEKPEPDQPVSLDNLTQSLLNTWDPKVPTVDVKEDQDTSKNSRLNSHQKVTLLQLLLGHKNEESVERNSSPQEVHGDVTKFGSQNFARTSVIESPSTSRTTPVSTPPLLSSTKAESPINLSQHSLVIKWNPPPFACGSQAEKPATSASNPLMDLTKSKDPLGEKPAHSEGAQNSATFSASKLLQNLAQCGVQASAPGEEQRPSKQLLSVNADRPLGMVERLSSPLLSNKTNAAEDNRAFGSPAAGPEAGLSGSEIENLLERRTVLQLLLGNPNKGKGDKKDKTPLRDESAQEHADRALSEQILTVKIKSEPCDDPRSPSPSVRLSPDARGAPFPGAAPPAQRSAPDGLKAEPVSPQDFSFSKNGLLSRLLRQNQESYLAEEGDGSRRSGELALLEARTLCVVPKKRKLYSEPLENPFKRMRNSVADAADSHGAPEGLYGPPLSQQELKCSRSDLEFKFPGSQGPAGDAEHRAWARESKSFNVLKQLLLSENCVRDLSQHRSGSAGEGRRKGHRGAAGGGKPELSIPALDGLLYGPAQPGGCGDSRTGPGPGPGPAPGPRPRPCPCPARAPPSPPFPEPGGCAGSRPEPGPANGCAGGAGDKGPIKWVIADADRNGYERDCPRLTKTNPILYYMLQKGGGPVAGRDTQDKDAWGEPSSAESVAQVTVKEEFVPAAETRAAGFSLRGPYSSPPGRSAPRPHSANGEGYGLLGNVLAIKKEAE
ncbi:nuclear receptor-interacting protein 1 isoform X1 [Canis lupus familiaris]|uniref:nuclear receptor-interacting protein 1 isoform X1 n=1 Tax=Canis lupus familiaris TaxID=9615 RepID=UPI0018F49AE2|nr:nuclear receptor-interacting protein 1 isoform X1 [Canis lupus familiaris]XP_005638820.2 nuclear receptor-interacting protein 1 isoform X1 [Canis lupus familiaris]XP_013965233.2 nuclear receptor-interacting protein 1 isoform X1 [Canis lupus familiaris]XP_022269057.2 nuclear receptor-interacting protein 1 isoform X1 [Canis lupus familiaris]XP_038317617.1 nuclear receptor-interacting protein 1 isoform X1 [Canis lupus familiaris]XP_038317618.1 nuclear receptor-interacting protein 1 isoform X1 